MNTSLAMLALFSLATPFGAQSQAPSLRPFPAGSGGVLTAPPIVTTPNQPPRLSSTLPDNAHSFVDEEIEFEVEATDPEGQATELRLLNPPPGMITEMDRAGARAELTCRWLVPSTFGGMQELVFEARDSAGARSRTTLVIRVSGASVADGFWDNLHMHFGDVTGDGVLDIVATASLADVGGVIDAGAIYVWAGGDFSSGAPTATLSVPSAAPADQLGGDILRLADVSGDGVLDIIGVANRADIEGIADLGAVYVWNGGAGLAGTRSPDASLFDTSLGAGARLAYASGQALHLYDLTNDGVLDLLTVTHLADVAGVQDAGALHLWKGGPTLTGEAAPTATLVRAIPRANDRLGLTRVGEAVFFGEVTGDGVTDVIVSATQARGDAGPESGAVFVWAGGPALVGQVNPRATLEGRAEQDWLGYSPFARGNGVMLVDLTGDGQLDILTASEVASTDEKLRTGAAWMWKGGANLMEKPAPTATFTVPGAAALDNFTSARIDGLADVTGDGLTDVVLGGAQLDGFAGAVYVWTGGAALSGAPAPTAKLAPLGQEQLTRSSSESAGVLFEDLSSNGTPDLVVSSVEGTYLWLGGAGLIGNATPRARLQGPFPGAQRGIQIGDVSGDGRPDIVTADDQGDGLLFPFTQNVGRITVFSGAFLLSGGGPLSDLTHRNAQAHDEVSSHFSLQGPNFRLADVTGDGTLDILAGSRQANAGGIDSGALYIWEGGPGVISSPTDSSRLTTGIASDRLTGAGYATFQLVDVDEDDLPDVITSSAGSDTTYVWRGGASSLGDPLPMQMTLADTLGSGELVRIADVTGDGTVDLICLNTLKDINGVRNIGAIRVWLGPLPTSASFELSVPGAAAFDRLGS